MCTGAGHSEGTPQPGMGGGEAGEPTRGSVGTMKEPQVQGPEPGCVNDGT